MNGTMHGVQKNLSPVKSIRAYCLDCSNGSANEVKLCPAENCPLYRYRFGKNPNRQGKKLTDEQRRELVQRMRNNLQKPTQALEETTQNGDILF